MARGKNIKKKEPKFKAGDHVMVNDKMFRQPTYGIIMYQLKAPDWIDEQYSVKLIEWDNHTAIYYPSELEHV